MTEQTIAEQAEAAAATEVETTKKRAAAANFLPIVSGRLPLIFVFAIRFNSAEVSNSELAKTYSTSVGKVFDIKKGRNFPYVTKDWKPTQADVDAATAWINAIETPNKHGLKPEGNAEKLKDILAISVANGLATEEEVAAQTSARVSTRKPKAPKAESAPAGEEAAPAEGDSESTADALLS